MVMSGSHCPKVGFTSDHEIVETCKAPHHSSVCIEDQYNTQISLPPLELHDPISHALEESYSESTLAQRRWSTFIMYACISQSRVCIYLTSTRCVTQHHGMSRDHMSCTFTHFCFVDACKLRVCLSSLLYLSHLLVHTTMLFANHAFTDMDQPMCQWLHWKYHFT